LTLNKSRTFKVGKWLSVLVGLCLPHKAHGRPLARLAGQYDETEFSTVGIFPQRIAAQTQCVAAMFQ